MRRPAHGPRRSPPFAFCTAALAGRDERQRAGDDRGGGEHRDEPAEPARRTPLDLCLADPSRLVGWRSFVRVCHVAGRDVHPRVIPDREVRRADPGIRLLQRACTNRNRKLGSLPGRGHSADARVRVRSRRRSSRPLVKLQLPAVAGHAVQEGLMGKSRRSVRGWQARGRTSGFDGARMSRRPGRAPRA